MTGRLVLLFIIFFSTTSQAQQIIENYYSARAAGMGNAFSAVVDDSTALMYNPAGLDKIRNLHITSGTNVGTDTLNIATTVTNITGNNYASTIQQFYGQEVWGNFNNQFAISTRDFAIGGYSSVVASFDLNNPAYPTAAITLNGDLAENMGFAVGLLPEDILRLGISGKRITRYGGSTTLTPSTLVTLSNTTITNLINSYGNGYGIDAGLILEMPVASHPEFSVVWHDIGQTAFSLQGGTNPLLPIDNNIVAGFSMNFGGDDFFIRPAFDFSHINLYEVAMGLKFHVGVECGFSIFTLRTGVNQGYLTYGAGVKYGPIAFDAAIYGEELDVNPGQLEDTRYIANLTFDLEFENNFSLTGKDNGPYRKAYERR
jgi:hypothetical protein